MGIYLVTTFRLYGKYLMYHRMVIVGCVEKQFCTPYFTHGYVITQVEHLGCNVIFYVLCLGKLMSMRQATIMPKSTV